MFRLRNRLTKVNAEITGKKWQFLVVCMGKELYNKTELQANPPFDKLFKPIMEERTAKGTIEGSQFLANLLKAQINALMIAMNQEYLTLMNITF